MKGEKKNEDDLLIIDLKQRIMLGVLGLLILFMGFALGYMYGFEKSENPIVIQTGCN